MSWICFAVTLAACWFDLRTREIPDALSIGLLVGGALMTFGGYSTWPVALGGLLLAFTLTAPLFYAGGIGGGDVKLVTAMGLWLGPIAILSVFFWIAIIGALLSIVAAVRGHRDLAYAPAIAGGLLIHGLCPALLSDLVN